MRWHPPPAAQLRPGARGPRTFAAFGLSVALSAPPAAVLLANANINSAGPGRAPRATSAAAAAAQQNGLSPPPDEDAAAAVARACRRFFVRRALAEQGVLAGTSVRDSAGKGP